MSVWGFQQSSGALQAVDLAASLLTQLQAAFLHLQCVIRYQLSP